MDGREPSIWVASETTSLIPTKPDEVTRDARGFDAQESPKGELVSSGQHSGAGRPNNATLRELFPFYGEHGKSRRTPSWLVFRSETIPSASSNRVRRIFCRSCSQ